jgi:exosome complex RNA-binding protein Rrp4
VAVEAIRMVEEEAHTANLTQRIKGLLNVPDTPPQEKGPLIAGTPKPAENESSIDEVEEELEVEDDK